MADIMQLCDRIKERFPQGIENTRIAFDELTVDIAAAHLHAICLNLRDLPEFDFKLLIDVCGVDYLQYGLSDWETESASATGFSRGVEQCSIETEPYRFVVVYHLLSITHNQRIRLRVKIPHTADTMVDSVMDIWPAADWYEREAFDLFGIIFRGHPDLRRILTDYGFMGHPFRKDFPLIGKVQVRYDAALKRVIYEPVSIEPRILEPRVIRKAGVTHGN